MEYLHQDGEEHEKGTYQHQGIVMNPVFVFCSHEGAVLQTLYQHEIDDTGGSDTSEDTDAVLHMLLVVERKDDTCQPLYQHTEEKRNGYRHEDGHDDGKGFICIDQIA